MSSVITALITATGTVGQITITGGENPVYAIANNPILPGHGSVVVPSGTTGQRILGLGAIRLNTTTGFFECSSDNATWQNLAIGGGGIASVTGTAGQIDVTAGPNPVISIDPAYVGQTSITTLGTIGTGVWAATAISAIHGGTSQTTYILGDTLYASAANTLSKLAGNTTAGIQYLAQTGTGVVSAAPVWTTISGGDISGAALTKVDDTNVTLTLGGTPTTALLRAASITAGWIGQLSLARGGTNAALVADNGALVYSTAGALALLASTATANQIPLSGSHAAPTWSTATYPATTTINQILYSSAANTIAGLATANSAALVTTSAGVPVWSGTMTSGQIIIGSTGATPVAASLTAGSGVTITPGAGSITISATGSGGTVTSVSGTLNRITSTGGTTPVIDISAAYVGQTSITTLGTVTTGSWNASIIPLAFGGSNANLTASNGGIVWSNATQMQILAGTATAGQMLQSGATATPAWSTSTYPSTNAINTLLYASSANVMAALATANNGVLITSAGGVPSISSTLPAAVQGNITSVGTITSGTWHGSVIDILYGGSGLSVANPNPVGGRLTLTSTVPVPTSDVTAATTIYFTPYAGDYIALYTSSAWKNYTFSEISIAVPASTNTIYDVFAVDSSGSVILQTVAWASDSARATGLSYQDGVLVKTGGLGSRYLGSFRTTGVSGQTEDSQLKRYVFNYYNRVNRFLFATDPSGGWTYTTAAFRQANANAANQVQFVCGLVEDIVSIQVQGLANNSNVTGAVTIASGIGINSTTVNSGFGGCAVTANGTAYAPMVSTYSNFPRLGLTTFAWLEYSSATPTTTWIATSAPFLSGISGTVRA